MISELFQVFFAKSQFFHCFDPYTSQVRNMRSAKNHFLVLIYSAKSNSDHFTIPNFSTLFLQQIFFTVSTPYTAQRRKVKSAKNHFLALFYSAKSISDHFTTSELFHVFFSKNQFFSLFRTLYCKGVRNMRSVKNHF